MSALIQSKLAPPPQAVYCVERKALLAMLNPSRLKRLSVISAPSGFGKSTLLSDWYTRYRRPTNDRTSLQRTSGSDPRIAWLSLDPQDNEYSRFFGYLTAAIRQVAPEFNPDMAAFDALAGNGDERLRLDAASHEFLAAIEPLTYGLTVVLDDFQWLRDEHLARAFGFVIWRSPAHVRWIVSGRCLPDLPLSQFRLHDQLHIIDQRQLSFDTPAIMQMCHNLRGITLTPEQAERLRIRTEGWAAGLKLTLLADEQTNASPVTQAARPPHDVARYIDTAVLEGLDRETREFLIITSIAERFNADLCNALLGITHAQTILDRLERVQLFVIPLDMEHRWYRFHTLFGECLRACLARDYANRLSALHLTASQWYAGQGLYTNALTHAFASDDRAAALQLLSSCARTLQKNGDIAAILRWTVTLTRDELLRSERVAIAHIVSLIFCRRFGEADALLKELEATGPSCRLGTLRLMYHVLSDTDCKDTSRDEVEFEGADSYLTGTLMTLQAYRLIRRNQFDAARRRATRARELLHEQGSKYGAVYADALLCMANRAVGNMEPVVQTCERMYAEAQHSKHDPTWMIAATSLALLRYEQNRLGEAESLCTEVLPLLSTVSTVEAFVTSYVTLARVKAIAGRYNEAVDLLDYLHGVLESTRQPHFLAYACFEKIRLYLSLGKYEQARALGREFKLAESAAAGAWSTPREFESSWERLGVSYAALLMSTRQTAECRITLQTLAASAQRAGYAYRAAPLYGMLATCEWQAGYRQAAFDALNVGLGFLRQTGFTRTAFDEAPLLRDVLAAAINTRQLQQPLPARFLEKFKSLFPAAHPAARAATARAPAMPLETLTERETDLLTLLALGLSNQEISERSQIALSTTKWHLKNVFAKLDVTTRTGALAKARALQLIQ
jgi:LuxR family maltose regulon positive regulatory protein